MSEAGSVTANPTGRSRAWDRYMESPFSIKNISLVYVWAGLFVLFSLWVPESFLSAGTWQSLAAEQAVTSILALAAVITLSSGVFDLSIAAILGAAAIFIAHLNVELGIAPVPAALLTLIGALLIGTISAIAIVFFRVNSFIATLGISSVLAAFVSAVSNNQQIIGLPESFVDWTTFKFLGIQGAFWIALVIAVVVWYFLEQRPVGRHMYATGANAEAAKLSGVKTNKVIFGTLLASALIAAVAGIVVTSRLGTGSPTIGPPYLLPAFAAAFLGSTQIKPGRFNVLGTLIAVYALATSVKGLQLAGAAFWLPELFNGVALVVAVALSVRRRRITPSAAAPEPPPPLQPQLSMREVARSELEQLRDSLDETVRMASLPEDGQGRVIEVAESSNPLRVSTRVGESVAFSSLDIDHQSEGGAHVMVSPDGEVITVSALVLDHHHAVGVISVAAPASRHSGPDVEELEAQVVACAGRISGELVASRPADSDESSAVAER